jgi:hypothetical protein
MPFAQFVCMSTCQLVNFFMCREVKQVDKLIVTGASSAALTLHVFKLPPNPNRRTHVN